MLDSCREWCIAGASPTGTRNDGLCLTAGHRRRRSVYLSPLSRGEREKKEENLRWTEIPRHLLSREPVKDFVERELQSVLLIKDVEVLVQNIIGCLHRLKDTHKSSVKDAIQEAIRSYSRDCEVIAHEILIFIAANLSVQAYDELTFSNGHSDRIAVDQR